MLSGCQIFPTSPPPISEEDEYFESDHFSISYPKGWSCLFENKKSPTRLDESYWVVYHIGDSNYEPYEIHIGFDKVFELISGRVDYVDSKLEDMTSTKRKLIEQGFNTMSNKSDYVILDGKKARKDTTIGKNPKGGSLEIVLIRLEHQSFICTIYYILRPDFNEEIRRRIEAVVNSIHLK